MSTIIHDISIDTNVTMTKNPSYEVWKVRIHKEYEKCQYSNALPHGITFENLILNESNGTCIGEFHCFVPFIEGSSALSLIPLIILEISTPYHINTSQGYPIQAPIITITQGRTYLPSEMIQSSCHQTFLLQLPELNQWNPSYTIISLLQQFVTFVQQNDPQPVAKNTKQFNGRHMKQETKLRMQKREIRGRIYQSQEVNYTKTIMQDTPLLLQAGKLVLFFSMSKTNVNEDFYYVREVISLRDVARITPQQEKSMTIFFKNTKRPCRTFLMSNTNDFINDLQNMIQSSSAKRPRDAMTSDENGSLSQLLSFLSPDQADKAKQISNGLMSKFGRFTSSVSRLLRGDENEDMEYEENIKREFATIEALKQQFFKTPSKAVMTKIATMLQHIADDAAHENRKNAIVEKALSDLQSFIEQPIVQRILMENCIQEDAVQGIRVHGDN